MSTSTAFGTGAARHRSPERRGAEARDGQPSRRPAVRPLDDGTTERVRVIEFLLPASAGLQPVLWLERQLLD